MTIKRSGPLQRLPLVVLPPLLGYTVDRAAVLERPTNRGQGNGISQH